MNYGAITWFKRPENRDRLTSYYTAPGTAPGTWEAPGEYLQDEWRGQSLEQMKLLEMCKYGRMAVKYVQCDSIFVGGKGRIMCMKRMCF